MRNSIVAGSVFAAATSVLIAAAPAIAQWTGDVKFGVSADSLTQGIEPFVSGNLKKGASSFFIFSSAPFFENSDLTPSGSFRAIFVDVGASTVWEGILLEGSFANTSVGEFSPTDGTFQKWRLGVKAPVARGVSLQGEIARQSLSGPDRNDGFAPSSVGAEFSGGGARVRLALRAGGVGNGGDVVPTADASYQKGNWVAEGVVIPSHSGPEGIDVPLAYRVAVRRQDLFVQGLSLELFVEEEGGNSLIPVSEGGIGAKIVFQRSI